MKTTRTSMVARGIAAAKKPMPAGFQRNPWWIAGLIIALLLAAFALTPAAGFGTVWDDDSLLLSGPQTLPGWDTARKAFVEGMFINPQAYWRPLPLLSFQLTNLLPIDERLHAAHLTALILALVYIVLVFAAGRAIGSALGVTSSAVLPMICVYISLHASLVETVAWIAGRFDLMLAMTSFLTFLIALSDYRKPSAIKSMALATAMMVGCLCKEIAPAANASALLAAFSIAVLGRSQSPSLNVPPRCWSHLALWLTATLAWIFCYSFIADHSAVTRLVKAQFAPMDQVQLAAWIFWKYLEVALLPWGFVKPIHAMPLAPLAGAVAGCAAIGIAAILAATFVFHRRWAALALVCAIGGPLLALALLGSSTGLNFEVVAADRYLLPFMPALLTAASIGALHVAGRSQNWPMTGHVSGVPWKPAIGMSVIAVAATVMNHNYIYAWQSYSDFWRSSWKRDRDSSLAALSWANDLINRGRMADALAVLGERSQQLKRNPGAFASPSFSWNELLIADYGEKLVNTGRVDAAITELEYWVNQRSLRAPIAYRVLALGYATRGNCAQARRFAGQAATGNDASSDLLDVTAALQAQLEQRIAACVENVGG